MKKYKLLIIVICMTFISACGDSSSFAIPEATKNMIPELDKDAGLILFALYTNDAWGIINGLGDIIVKPEYCFTSVLTNELYFISDDPIKLTTGKIYQVDGTRFLPELGDLTIFGGGPDCDTAHIITNVFLYEENGLKGLVSADGTKLTEPQYIDLSKREEKYRDDSIYANLPETIFYKENSQYELRLDGWSSCVTDSPQSVRPQGLEDLLRTFS